MFADTPLVAIGSVYTASKSKIKPQPTLIRILIVNDPVFWIKFEGPLLRSILLLKDLENFQYLRSLYAKKIILIDDCVFYQAFVVFIGKIKLSFNVKNLKKSKNSIELSLCHVVMSASL